MNQLVRRHLPAFLILVAATIWWIGPVAREPSGLIPGSGPGDNLTFVWNVWWAGHTIQARTSLFSCGYLFAPFGTDLTLDTLAALPSLLAAALSRGHSVVAATNALVAVDLLLNFAAAYALFWRIRPSATGATIAAVIFGCCPYLGSHLRGHFNLVAAWPLPLATLFLLMTLESATTSAAALLGLAWGLTPYVDYYDAVYVSAIAVLLVLRDGVSVVRAHRPVSTLRLRTLQALALVLCVDVFVAGFIAATGGTTLILAGHAIALRRIDNPVSIAGLLCFALVAFWLLPRVRLVWHGDRLMADLRRLVIPAFVACVMLVPLAYHAALLVRRGDYVSQHYLWRSAPAGVDLSTLMLGNPYGLLTGSIAATAYSHFHIDVIEQIAWLGPGVLALCAIAGAAARRDRAVRLWIWIAAIFFVWSLGPYLLVLGRPTHLILPEILLRFVPIVANARIPGRAMAVVYLAVALLAGIGLDELRRRRRRLAAAALFGLVILDYLPAPTTVYRLDHPAIYDVLRQQPPGGAIELPLGLRDGFGEVGQFDSRILWYQTIHEHPIAGGFVARLSPRIVAEYQAAPVLGSLLRLSGGASLGTEPRTPKPDAGAALKRLGFRFVILNNDTAPADLLTYIHRTLPLRLIVRGERRDLYSID